MSKKEISILGCGWLGFPLAQSLIDKGFSVKGTTTSSHKLDVFSDIGIKPFLIDIENPTTAILNFLNADVLVIAVTPKSIAAYLNLIEGLENSKVKQVIFISSTSVYGNHETEITEEFPVKDTLLSQAENLFKNNPSYKTTIIRFAGLIGYSRKPSNFFKNGRKIENPYGVVNMIHRDDCINIIEKIISLNIYNETFNACADTHPTRRDFYTHAFLCSRQNEPEFIDNGSIEIKQISNHKLKRILDYKFQYPDLLRLDCMPFD